MPSRQRSAVASLSNVSALVAAFVALAACGKGTPPASGRAPGDSAFKALATEIIQDNLRRHPSSATALGVHAYDSTLDDLSAGAFEAEARADSAFRDRLVAADTSRLSLDQQLDRQQLIHAMDANILGDRVIKAYTKNPDVYSSGVTNAAYVIMERDYAPAAQRLAALIARERAIPAALAQARASLSQPPKIFTEIAIEQLDGNVSFFKNDVTAAFKDVTDTALRRQFNASNAGVMKALGDYKTFLQHDLLPKSTGSYALGADTYAKDLAANEMIDVPLPRLLEIAEADRQKNEAAFQATARLIDSTKPADSVLASLQADHPPEAALLSTTQNMLDSLRQFIASHHILTIPPGDPARVKETPPFMRSTTTASMDTPGPFEAAKLAGFFNMTLPDPRWPRAEQDAYMKQWYYAAISNVAVHEVYPGHYIQFLYAKRFPTDVRKVYGAASNSEGWAHYDEQMMLDEGFHAGDPKYRLAQLQDALLRDVRFIVGIKLHTQGMTVDDATKLFETEGHQPHPVAVEEAKRGTGDPLYGYYTIGKLMILKLRDDYKAKQGASYTLQGFHDAFLALGPLPLPLIRRAMLGETGTLF
ncbi:MAG TPA: DUF885 domain-containing protein [Gemmatimonadaceae bacterium]|nr:DUF885 domain-containing protein [Gemmatimonadaceae bacterium]